MRRVFFWYDGLTDWQRLKYAGVAILFLLACGGYLLGLGSTILLQRVEAQGAGLAALPLPTVEPTPTMAVVEASPTPEPTRTPAPSPTAIPPTAAPTVTPFSAPVIAEPPAAPRQVPAAPAVIAPSAPRATPTADKPRNLETSKPEPPAASVATSTPGQRAVRTVLPTAVRQATPVATSKPAPTEPPPTTAAPATAAPTAAPAASTPRATVAATPVKTPAR